jgi:hypothetical protein
MIYLAINRCPIHRDFLSVAIEEEDGGGTRITPSKCCGRWETLKRWPLEESQWLTVASLAKTAARKSVTPRKTWKVELVATLVAGRPCWFWRCECGGESRDSWDDRSVVERNAKLHGRRVHHGFYNVEWA